MTLFYMDANVLDAPPFSVAPTELSAFCLGLAEGKGNTGEGVRRPGHWPLPGLRGHVTLQKSLSPLGSPPEVSRSHSAMAVSGAGLRLCFLCPPPCVLKNPSSLQSQESGIPAALTRELWGGHLRDPENSLLCF